MVLALLKVYNILIYRNNVVTAFFQLGLHIGARGVSAALSFLLFALYMQYFGEADLAQIFAYGFLFGALISTTRITSQLVARVSGEDRKTQKFRQATMGFSAIKLVIVPVSIAAFALTYQTSESLAISGIAMTVVVFAVLDVDLIRSVYERGPLFSPAFSVGSVLALGVFWIVPEKSVNLAVIAIVLQWVPTAWINRNMLRLAFRSQHKITKTLLATLCSGILAAIFDGVVLNTPFLWFWGGEAQEQVSMGITLRIFVSSLPFMTLLVHWANTSYIDGLSKVTQLPKRDIFGILLFLSIIASGAVFLLLFETVADRNATLTEIICYLLISITFSFCFSNIRFARKMPQVAHILPPICIYLGALGFLSGLDQFTALNVAIAQSMAFAVTGLFVRKR